VRLYYIETMNRIRAVIHFVQHWNAALPLCATLLAIAIHSGFRNGDFLGIAVALFATAAVYTVAPFMQLQLRTVLAPLILGFAYTCVPYLFALLNLGILPQGADFIWLAGLYLIGVGDSAIQGSWQKINKKPVAGIPLFIARFGKDIACFTGLAGIALGSLVFIWQVHNALWLVAYVALFLGAMAFTIITLADTPGGSVARLTVIATDTLVHGLLVTIAVAYICISAGASAMTSGIVTGVCTCAFLSAFFWFIAQPPQAIKQR
jgi:hypothetical protein